MLVRDKSLGRTEEFNVSGLYRIDDPKNGASMQIVNIDTYGVSHAVLSKKYDEIEKTVGEEVFKAQIIEGLQSVLNEACTEITRNKDMWGYWCGRIVNNSKPHEYLAVNLEGIKRTSEMRLCLEKVQNNKVVDSFECDIKTDPENAVEVQAAIHDLYLKSRDFARNSIKDFSISSKGFTKYSPDMYQAHYDILQNMGFEEQANSAEYHALLLEEMNIDKKMENITHIKRGRK